MSKPENPPAFPQDIAGRRSDDPSLHGMSLRDWFAGQALPALFEDHQKSVREGEFKCYPNWPEGIAQDSYRIADAMLAARQREEPQP